MRFQQRSYVRPSKNNESIDHDVPRLQRKFVARRNSNRSRVKRYRTLFRASAAAEFLFEHRALVFSGDAMMQHCLTSWSLLERADASFDSIISL